MNRFGLINTKCFNLKTAQNHINNAYVREHLFID